MVRYRLTLLSRSLQRLLPALILLLLLAAGQAEARKIWVATNGTDAVGANFGTETNPFRTISFAYGQRNFNAVDTIFVRPGTYNESISVFSGAAVFLSEKGADSTIIDGQGDGYIFFFSYGIDDRNVVDGFTITRGNPTGIVIQGFIGVPSSPQIRNCRIFQNGSVTSDVWGAGISLEASRAIISNNYFGQNYTLARGGAIDCAGSQPRIINNVFEDNRSLTNNGGAIHVFESSAPLPESAVVIQNNIFIDNKANQHGGAIFLTDNARANIFNNLFYRDSSGVPEGGGAIYHEVFAQPLIYNNIFMENIGYASNCLASDDLVMFNNAFYQNIPFDLPTLNCAIGTGNLFGVDPQFENLAARDYRLAATSALIDTGRSLPYWAHYDDFAGSPRYAGAAIDIGPYENCGLAVEDFTWLPAAPCVGELIDLNVDYLSYWDTSVWDFGDGDLDTFRRVDEILPPKTYLTAGDYVINVTFMCLTDTVTISKPITILSKPVAAIAASDTVVCAGTVIDFTAADSDSGQTFAWLFADGDSSSLPNPSHQFNLSGQYNVRLIVSGLCGADTATLLVDVVAAPNASLNASLLSGSAPLLVNFTGSSDFPATSWNWDFGDGSTSALQSPAYTYERPGIYDVSLTATNACGEGLSDSRLDYIRVSGFDLVLLSADSLTTPREIVYSLVADTIFGNYDRGINLSASVLPANPRRGSATVQLSTSSTTARTPFTATLRMSPDLAKGVYTLQVIATSVSNLPRDTIRIDFYSNPGAIAAFTPLELDFGQVEADEVESDTIFVKNQLVSAPGQTLTLSVQNVVSSNIQFEPLVVSGGPLLPGAQLKIPVRVTPTTLGPTSGELTIHTDDPVSPIQIVSVLAEVIPERKAPSVISVTPEDGANGVLIGTSILLALSEPAADSTIDVNRLSVRALRTGTVIAGEQDVTGENTQWLFTPNVKLPEYDTIEVRLLGTVKDRSGNSLDGNGNGIAEGSPLDDFVTLFVTGPAVYPGDCNNDGHVDEADILPLGVYFDLEGPSRSSYGEGNTWAAKQALEWETPLATYADANGDGTVNTSDILLIAQHWGQTRSVLPPSRIDVIDYSLYAESFRQLQPALEALAGTEGGNRMLTLVNSLVSLNVLPTEFSLLQNFPNPFNPQTQISYSLPLGCAVRLTVHNILGQTVRTLVDTYEEAGFRSVQWDGTDQLGRSVSSGVYFYRLEAGSYLEIRKMLKLQ